ncbi:MAG: hypothetical protein PHQ64_02035 [Bacilli bacterium]|nr:hypothetical protein [Bacilli bacterium]
MEEEFDDIFNDIEISKIYSITLSSEYIKKMIDLNILLNDDLISQTEYEKELEELNSKGKKENVKTR